MNLGEFRDQIEKSGHKTIFPHGVSEPFSWRGSYHEVAFHILYKEPMSREDILSRIDMALDNIFRGFKGGGYQFNRDTNVNFEYGVSSYSDGRYCENLLHNLESDLPYKSNEQMVVDLAFPINNQKPTNDE